MLLGVVEFFLVIFLLFIQDNVKYNDHCPIWTEEHFGRELRLSVFDHLFESGWHIILKEFSP